MINKIIQSISDITFPQVCVCCGNSINVKSEYICYLCKMKKFESAADEDPIILPDKIAFQFAMWRFDKGGYLQLLLHKLKYDYLKEVGEQMGDLVGEKLLKTNNIKLIEKSGYDPIVVPVPLHPSKKRKRGYNQARSIGIGLAKKTGWELIDEGIVNRVRKTTTQTGLDSNERTKNLKKAFLLSDDRSLADRFPIIVDDVFTTGATTFELADELIKKRCLKAGIVTIAIA